MSSDQTLDGRATVVGDVVELAAASEGGFAIGARIADRYTIVRFLGRGGMGDVYEADDDELHEPVAIKVLRLERLDDPRTAAMLKREIVTARRVTHPNVCRVFDVEYHQGGGQAVAFFTMEVLRGETLADRISRRGALPVDEALPIVEQLAAALAAAHGAGVIHRDFKPHNVMLVPRPEGGERAVVTDFGLAIAIESGDPTRSMELMGTPAYMAPEQLTGGAITGAVDLYALGVSLYEMVTGQLPFSAATPLATALARVTAEPPSPRKVVADLDPRWDRAIRRCLARDPADRFATAPEVIEALRGSAPRRGRRAWLIGGGAVAAVAIAATAVVAASSGSGRPLARRPSVFVEHATGPVQRALNLGGAAGEKIEDAVEDAEGNLVLVGHYSGVVRLGDHVLPAPAGGSNTPFVIKLDRAGHVLWTRVIPTTGKGRIRQVVETPDGSLVVAGAFETTIDLGDGPHRPPGAEAGFLLAMSPLDGSTRWSRLLEGSSGGNARSMAVGPDGNLYVGGDLGGQMALDDLILDGKGMSPYLASFTPTGAVRWAFSGTGGTNSRIWAMAFRGDDVLVGGSAAGDVRFAGASWRDDKMRIPFIVAVDGATGRPRWARTIPAHYGEVKTIAVSPSGRVVAGGGFARRIEAVPGTVTTIDSRHNGAYLVELDGDSGASIRVLPVTDTVTDRGISHARFLDDDRLLVVGGFGHQLTIAGRTLSATSERDVYLAILDRSGRATEATQFGGPDREHVRRLWIRRDGTVAIAGKHQGLAIGGVQLATNGMTDGFYLELRLDQLLAAPLPAAVPSLFVERATGPLRRILTLGGAGIEEIKDAVEDVDGNVFLIGYLSSELQLGDRVLPAPASKTKAPFVVALDPGGRVRWTRVFPATGLAEFFDGLLGIEGSLIVSGNFQGTIDVGDGTVHRATSGGGVLLALSPDEGSVRWSRMIAASGAASTCCVAMGPDGDLHVAGVLSGAADLGTGTLDGGIQSPYLASYSPEGAPRRAIVGRGGSSATVAAVAVRDRDVLLAGMTTGDVRFAGASWRGEREIETPFVVAVDVTGRPRWSRTFSTDRAAVKAIAVSPSGRVVVGGDFMGGIEPVPGSSITVPPMHVGAWLAELDGDTGAPTRRLVLSENPIHHWISHLGFLDDDRLLVGGRFGASLSVAGKTFTALGESDTYLAIIDRGGTATAAGSIGGPAIEQLSRFAIRRDGTVAVTGAHRGLELGDVSVATRGLEDGFYAELRLEELFR